MRHSLAYGHRRPPEPMRVELCPHAKEHARLVAKYESAKRRHEEYGDEGAKTEMALAWDRVLRHEGRY